MASNTVGTITSSLSKLGIEPPAAEPASFPEANAVDLMRNYITDELHRLSSIDKSIIYPALDTPSTLDKGDLIVPLPRLRLKGVNPKEKAVEWAAAFEKGKLLSEVKA